MNVLNFTIRNTATFLNDKLQLDLGASYVKQKDKNMVSQGQYWNPVMAAYLFPRGEDFDGIKSFEHFDESRQLPVQYWPWQIRYMLHRTLLDCLSQCSYE